MSGHRRSLTIIVLVLSSLFLVAHAKRVVPSPPTALGIEIALVKPFYVPAATEGKVTTVVIRVPLADGVDLQKEISAIKLEPKMDKGKVSVEVFALRGNANNIKTCREWDSLQATVVGTYVASLDEEISLTKLREYGVSLGKDPLTFRVVAKRTLSPLPPPSDYGELEGGRCGCASCGGLICCPNSGYCIGCGSCGSVCCSSNEAD
jgi:hypothetical protein